MFTLVFPNCDVRYEADVLHEFLALPERIQAKHGKIALAVGKPEHSLEQSGLARAVRADQTHDPAFFDVEADVVDSTHFAESL